MLAISDQRSCRAIMFRQRNMRGNVVDFYGLNLDPDASGESKPQLALILITAVSAM
jgi:hypothetical protein